MHDFIQSESIPSQANKKIYISIHAHILLIYVISIQHRGGWQSLSQMLSKAGQTQETPSSFSPLYYSELSE